VAPERRAAPAPVPPPAPARAGDPQARAALRKAAAEQTLAGRELLERGLAEGAEPERHALLLRALNAYGLAARGWTRLFAADPEAADAGETRFWIADAWQRIVVLEDAVDGTPSPEELAAARRAAVAARATSHPQNRAAAAGLVVAVADLALKVQHRLHARTRGAQGIEERRQIRTTGEGAETRVVKDPLPREVEDAIAARDAYLELVPAADDAAQRRADFASQAAELYFLHGHLAEARRRFLPLNDPARCGPSEIGYHAWYRLTLIANLESNIAAARALAEARLKHACNPEGPGPRPPGPVPWGPFAADAYRLFQRAEKMPPGPERDQAWRDAAAVYRAALERVPDRDEAPEYALNGAYAYKQVGGYAEALALYRLFLSRYGSEASLERLARGDPEASPPRAPDPRRYDERRRYAQMAAEQVAAAEVLLFDYPAAAAAYDALARNRHFEPKARRDAAYNAVLLHAHAGERDRMLAARAVHAALAPAREALAEVEWLVARASLAAWDERAPDAGANRAARLVALAEVERFAAHHEARPEAAPLLAQAAGAAARLRRAAGEPLGPAWCARAARAFDRTRAARPGDPPLLAAAEPAASCALDDIEGSARADFGAPPSPRRYRGDAAAIERAFQADLGRVDAHARRIEDLARRFGPGPWLVAARAAHAALLDACSAGLAPLAAGEPLQRALRAAEARAARAHLEVVVTAAALRTATPDVVVARRRLSVLARRLGEPAMQAIGAGTVDPASGAPFVYREGMFSAPPGMEAVGGDLLAAPLPVEW
jgi:hypothetical protein